MAPAAVHPTRARRGFGRRVLGLAAAVTSVLLLAPASAPAAAPANDNFANATVLSGSLPLSDAASNVTHNAIQTFGGIGFTWEHDIHFFLKRAKVSAQLLGGYSELDGLEQ